LRILHQDRKSIACVAASAVRDHVSGTCAGNSGTDTDIQPVSSVAANNVARRTLLESGQRSMDTDGVADSRYHLE